MGGKGGLGKKAKGFIGDTGKVLTVGTVDIEKGKIATSTNEMGTNFGQGFTFKGTRNALSSVPETPGLAELPAAPDEGAAARDADAALIERMRRSTGRASTLLTGSMGLNTVFESINSYVMNP